MYPALLCYWELKQKSINKKAYIGGFLIFGAYAIYKLFDTNGIIDWIKFHNASSIAATMKAEVPWVEESREFFGLSIILAVMAFNYYKSKKVA